MEDFYRVYCYRTSASYSFSLEALSRELQELSAAGERGSEHEAHSSEDHVPLAERNYPPSPEREARIRRVLAQRQKDLTLVLSNIHDPHNVSAIYRSCDAFGVPMVHLHYTDTPFPSLGAKSSASARKWVGSVRHADAQSLMQSLKEQGMAVYATSFSPRARPLGEYDFVRPTAFILGNEHAGVEEGLISLADAEVYIPMYGMIQSFNVSVAAAILLAEASRQRLAAGKYAAPTYSEEELAALYAQWSRK